MKRVFLGALIGFVVAGILSAGALLLAQEREQVSGPMVVLGGLRLKEGVNAEDAEKLLKEQLVPTMKGIEGLDMKVLKRRKMQQGGETEDSGAYDYIMMAEIENLQVFMKLMQKGYQGETGLSNFGDMMKEYAGHPYINVYTIIAETEEETEETE